MISDSLGFASDGLVGAISSVFAVTAVAATVSSAPGCTAPALSTDSTIAAPYIESVSFCSALLCAEIFQGKQNIQCSKLQHIVPTPI